MLYEVITKVALVNLAMLLLMSASRGSVFLWVKLADGLGTAQQQFAEDGHLRRLKSYNFV